MGITDELPFYFERSLSRSSYLVSLSLARDFEVDAPEATSQTHFEFIKRNIIFKTF